MKTLSSNPNIFELAAIWLRDSPVNAARWLLHHGDRLLDDLLQTEGSDLVTWKKINLAMALPHFGEKPMSDPKLEDLFGINDAQQNKIALMAGMMKSSMDISTLSHVVSHVKEKLVDPSSKGCTEAINDLMNRIWAELTLEEIPLLIDAVEPPGGFVGPGGMGGMQVQTFEGTFEDFIRFILGGGLGGIEGSSK